MLSRLARKYEDHFYLVFRIFVGLMFAQHGAQKLFGLLGGKRVELFSLFGLAGVIEFLGGILIAIGLFARVAALFGAFTMLGAWFISHIKNGWIPIINKGELALLYFAAFLIILVYGSKKFGLDNKFFKLPNWFN
mgnify:CR=1 FL=1